MLRSCFGRCVTRAEGGGAGDGGHGAVAAAAAQRAEDITRYLLHHGSFCMAYSTTQPGVSHFVLEGVGYLAYSEMLNGPNWLGIRSAVVLGDPVAPSASWALITQRFLDSQKHRREPPIFLQVSRAYAAVLASLGFRVNCFGGEVELRVDSWSLSSQAKHSLRAAVNAARRAGLVAQEAAHVGAALREEMAAVDTAWVAGKGGNAGAVWLLNRPPVLADEPGVRKFIVRGPSGELQAFVCFDPMYEEGQLVGYYANVTRMTPSAHRGALNLLMKTAMDTLKAEQQQQQQQQQQQTLPMTAGAAPPPACSVARRARSKAKKKARAGDLGAVLPPAAVNAGEGGKDDAAPLPLSPALAKEGSDASSFASSSSGSGACWLLGTKCDVAAKPASLAACAGDLPGATLPAVLAPARRPLVVSLGMAPLCALKEDPALNPNPHMARQLARGFASSITAAFYPYQQVALSKLRYGGKLDPDTLTFSDAAAIWNPVYLAHAVHGGRLSTFVKLFDISKHLGFYSGLADSGARVVKHHAKLTVRRIGRCSSRSSKLRRSCSISSVGSSGAGSEA